MSIHPSGGRRSFNSFYRSFLARSLGGLARENLFRSSHSLYIAAAISCVPIISHLESRPVPSLSFNPFRPDDGHSAPLELFLPSRSRLMRVDRSAIYRGATRVPVGLAPLLIPRGEGDPSADERRRGGRER